MDALRWVLANPGGISLSGSLSAPFFCGLRGKITALVAVVHPAPGRLKNSNGAAEIPAQAGEPTSELKLGKNAVEIAQAHRCGFEIVTSGFHQAVGAEVQPEALNIFE